MRLRDRLRAAVAVLGSVGVHGDVGDAEFGVAVPGGRQDPEGEALRVCEGRMGRVGVGLALPEDPERVGEGASGSEGDAEAVAVEDWRWDEVSEPDADPEGVGEGRGVWVGDLERLPAQAAEAVVVAAGGAEGDRDALRLGRGVADADPPGAPVRVALGVAVKEPEGAPEAARVCDGVRDREGVPEAADDAVGVGVGRDADGGESVRARVSKGVMVQNAVRVPDGVCDGRAVVVRGSDRV